MVRKNGNLYPDYLESENIDMRLLGHEEDYENPAWPGLVDLFAFTMVIFVMFLALEAKGRDHLKEKNMRLQTDVKKLHSEINILRSPSRPSVAAQIQKQGEQCLAEIRDQFNRQMPVRTSINNKQLKMTVNLLNHQSISFDTAQWKLAPEDVKIIKDYAPILFNIIKDQPVILIINGSADPRHYCSRTPPCDNVDLSALRAATVARILDESAPGIVKKIQVVGLGAEGKLVEDASKAETEYRKYRSLTFVVRVNKDEIIDNENYLSQTN